MTGFGEPKANIIKIYILPLKSHGYLELYKTLQECAFFITQQSDV